MHTIHESEAGLLCFLSGCTNTAVLCLHNIKRVNKNLKMTRTQVPEMHNQCDRQTYYSAYEQSENMRGLEDFNVVSITVV